MKILKKIYWKISLKFVKKHQMKKKKMHEHE